jgi:hypothetical protein
MITSYGLYGRQGGGARRRDRYTRQFTRIQEKPEAMAKNVEKSLAWKTSNCGVHNAAGKRLVLNL